MRYITTTKYIKLIILLLICNSGHAKIVELQTTIEDIGLSRIKGIMIIDGKEFQLSGRTNVTKVPKSNNRTIQILWDQVQKDGEQDKYFKKSLSMNYIKPKIEKGTKLEFMESEEYIKKALENLKDVPSKEKVETPKSTIRSLTPSSGVVGTSLSTTSTSNTSQDPTSQKRQTQHAPARAKRSSLTGEVDRQVGGGDYYSGGSYSRQNGGSYGASSTGVGNNGDARNIMFGGKLGDHGGSKKSNHEKDNTRIEACDDCPIRIDLRNMKAIPQHKTITWQGDVKVKESECADGIKYFLIKKDYLCENCNDIVDLHAKKAWPTFEYFYHNENGKRITISKQPEKDKELEFNIVIDKDCPAHLDIEDMKAYPQVQLVYQDRANNKKVAKSCHIKDRSLFAPITLTCTDCVPTHDFVNKWSIQQKKGVYELDDQEHIAFPCKEVGRPSLHKYDLTVCQFDLNVDGRRVSRMGKKYVEFDGEKEYLSDCEPADDAAMVLLESTEGCEGQYVHKFDEGRSYLKKRWYFLDLDQKQFVTPCNKSTEFLLHKIDITGYESNDVTKKAKPIVTVYIEPEENNKLELKTNYIDPTVEPTPYSLVSTVDEETDSFVYSGCYKVTQTNRYKNYTRPDGTNYKEFVGIGTPRKSKSLCRTTTETKDVYHHTHVWATDVNYDRPLYEFDVTDPNNGKYQKVGSLRSSESGVNTASSSGVTRPIGQQVRHRCAKFYSIYKRIITHYPNGRVSTGTWSNTGKIKKGSTFYAKHIGDSGIWTPQLKEVRSFKVSY